MTLTQNTKIGNVTICEEKKQIVSISLCADVACFEEASPLLLSAFDQLDKYFDGSLKNFDLPLKLLGTPFQVRVWRELLKIGYAQTASYGEIARRIGNPRASRAVGTACNRNKIAIVVPCHRVVASNGIGGYAGGAALKRRLLELEKSGDGEV